MVLTKVQRGPPAASEALRLAPGSRPEAVCGEIRWDQWSGLLSLASEAQGHEHCQSQA